MGAYPLLKSDRPIVFFDSYCLLCNRTVQLLLRIDRRELFIFAGMSGGYGVHILSENKIEDDSVILYYQGKYSIKSNAFLAILKLLGFPYSIISVVYIIPKFIRDWVYDIIARNRKNWFGATEHCLIDTNKYSNRILL